MDKYQLKPQVQLSALQWRLGIGIDGVTRYCQQFCINTGRGVLRVNTNDYVVKGPLGIKFVLTADQFESIFEKVDNGNER